MNWRVLLGGLLAGVVAFGWSSISWMALPFREAVLRPMPVGEAESSALFSRLAQAGVYHWPPMPFTSAQVAGDAADDGQIQQDRATAEWMERMKAGPRVTMMVYSPNGADPTSPLKYVVTLACYVVAGWVAAWVTWSAGRVLVRFFDRVAAVLGMGLFATLIGVVPHLLWWDFPLEYAFLEIVDPLVAWLLGGLVIGAVVVRPVDVPVTVERL